MSSRYLFLRWFLGAALALAAFAVAPSVVFAQDEEEEETSDEEATEESSETSAPAPGRTGSGAPMESWLAMGIALGLGAVVLAVGGILGRLALDENAVALDARTTQLVAAQSHQRATDYALASTVLFSVGAVIMGIGATWAIILPFSTPPGTTIQARISPVSIGLEGTF